MSKKILLLLVVSFFVGKNCEAQNLVPNPSFEDTIECPFDFSHITFSEGWNSFRDSPDYFNSCSNSSVCDVPNNIFGSRQAFNGNAYAGLIAFYPEVREFIGRQLSSPLIIGTKYFVIMKVSLSSHSGLSCNNLGIAFSTNQYNNSFNPAPINNLAIIYSSTLISDTINWIDIAGSFIADSSYEFIRIGNFFDDEQTDTVRIQSNISFGSYLEAYYYIDDICVSPDSLACDLNPEGIYSSPEKNSITIFPNPVSEQLTVKSEQLASSIELYDVFGRKLLSDAIPRRDGIARQIDIQSLPSGIYFIKVYFADGSMEVKKFVKQ